MTNTFNFDSRETYLAYRAEWRAKYKEISQEIRQTKRDLQALKGQVGREVEDLQRKLHYQRIRANKLMIELEAAKEFKNTQLAASQSVAA